MCIYIYIYLYIYTYKLYLYKYTNIFICIFQYIYVYIYIYICIYIYIYLYIYLYIYVYVHTCIHVCINFVYINHTYRDFNAWHLVSGIGMFITGQIVWARPPCAEIPLWNEHDVRGKIVAIRRGPAAPATGVGYVLSIYVYI